MRLALLCLVFLVGCSDDRKKTLEDFIADCKKANATMSVTYTLEGRFGQSLSFTCTPKDHK